MRKEYFQEVCKEEMAGLYFSAVTAKEAPKYTETDRSLNPNLHVHPLFNISIWPPLPSMVASLICEQSLTQFFLHNPFCNPFILKIWGSIIQSILFSCPIPMPRLPGIPGNVFIREFRRLAASALLQLPGGGHGKLRGNGRHHNQHQLQCLYDIKSYCHFAIPLKFIYLFVNNILNTEQITIIFLTNTRMMVNDVQDETKLQSSCRLNSQLHLPTHPTHSWR